MVEETPSTQRTSIGCRSPTLPKRLWRSSRSAREIARLRLVPRPRRALGEHPAKSRGRQPGVGAATLILPAVSQSSTETFDTALRAMLRSRLGERLVAERRLARSPPDMRPCAASARGRSPTLSAAQGIERLWSHQVEAIAAARAGDNVLVTTATASGKSLVFQLPVLEEALGPVPAGAGDFPVSPQGSGTGSARQAPDSGAGGRGSIPTISPARSTTATLRRRNGRRSAAGRRACW